MTTQKDIELLKLFSETDAKSFSHDLQDAITHGIKALRFCQVFSDTEVPAISPNLKNRLRQLISLETFASFKLPGKGAHREFPVLPRPNR